MGYTYKIINIYGEENASQYKGYSYRLQITDVYVEENTSHYKKWLGASTVKNTAVYSDDRVFSFSGSKEIHEILWELLKNSVGAGTMVGTMRLWGGYSEMKGNKR